MWKQPPWGAVTATTEEENRKQTRTGGKRWIQESLECVSGFQTPHPQKKHLPQSGGKPRLIPEVNLVSQAVKPRQEVSFYLSKLQNSSRKQESITHPGGVGWRLHPPPPSALLQ